LWPANLGGVVGFRRQLPSWPVVLALAIPSLAGGAVGAVLLLRTSPRLFELLAPLLVLLATALFALQGRIARWTTRPRTAKPSLRVPAAAIVIQFVVGVYGGFFGAGIGLMMLAALAVVGLDDVHRMNGVKNLLAVAINGMAAAYFIARGAVLWIDVELMALGAFVGGLAGAGLAQRLGQRAVRRAVVVIGTAASVSLALRAFW
jgi:uncharacterized membrane protein YfcA